MNLIVEELKIDVEFEKLIPPLTDEEYELLHASIGQHGCLNPIIVWNNTIIDGHNRYRICCILKMPFETKPIYFESKEEAKLWIVEHQISKRNLKPAQKIALAFKMKPFIAAKAKANQVSAGGAVPIKVSNPIDTRDELARIAGVSPAQISKWEKIISEATEEDLAQFLAGKISISALHKKLQTQESTRHTTSGTPKTKMYPLLTSIENKIHMLKEAPQELLSDHKDRLKGMASLLTGIINLCN